MIIKCLYCEREFLRHPSDVKNGRAKFCSFACRRECTDTRTEKACSKCPNILPLSEFYSYIRGERLYHQAKCKECHKADRKARAQQFMTENNKSQETVRRTRSVRSFLRPLVNRSWRKEISLDYVLALLEAQEYKCAVSGIPLTFLAGKGVVQTNASIDRKNPAEGYTPENIQIVCRAVNTMKMDAPQGDLYKWCRMILENAPVQ